jgi:hypothetical protein
MAITTCNSIRTALDEDILSSLIYLKFIVLLFDNNMTHIRQLSGGNIPQPNKKVKNTPDKKQKILSKAFEKSFKPGYIKKVSP